MVAGAKCASAGTVDDQTKLRSPNSMLSTKVGAREGEGKTMRAIVVNVEDAADVVDMAASALLA
jgi:hypothetical protein